MWHFALQSINSVAESADSQIIYDFLNILCYIHSYIIIVVTLEVFTHRATIKFQLNTDYSYILYKSMCAADFSLLNLPKGKSLGRSKPATNS